MVWRKDKSDVVDWEGQHKKHMEEIMGMKILQENKELIKGFDGRSQNNIKTRIGYLVGMKTFLRHSPNKPFKKFERDDFNEWLKYLDSKYKLASVNHYLASVKMFFRFVLNLDDETPPCMKGIKRKKIDWGEREAKLSKNILTKEEILKLINATTNRKYKAMISVLFDGALRKSELVNQMIGDYDIKDDYIDLTVRNGKGGRTDVVTLIDSVPYVKAWLSEHPFRNDPNAPMWIRERNMGKPLPVRKWCIEWLIQTLPKKAGIRKHVWVHLTRHSKASSMLDEGYSIVEAKQHLRHRSLSSTMIYSHLTENGLKEKMLAKSGKLPERQKNENPMKPIVCERCKEENPVTNKFCSRCGWEFGKDLSQVKLESEEQRITKEFMNFVMNNPEASKFMGNMMRMFVSKKQSDGEKNL